MKRQHGTIKSRFVRDPRQCVPRQEVCWFGRNLTVLFKESNQAMWTPPVPVDMSSWSTLRPHWSSRRLEGEEVWTGLIIHVHHTAGKSGLNRESQLSQSIHLRASGLNTDITSQDSDQLQLSDNPRVMHSNMEFLQKQREKILKWQKRYDCIDGNSTKMLS